MKKSRIAKKIFSLLLIAAFSTISVISAFGADFTVSLVSSVTEADSDSAAYIVFGKNMITNKAEAIISDNPIDVNYNAIVEHEGRECVTTEISRNETNNGNDGITKIPIKVDDDYIGPEDRNIAVSVTFFDHNWDTMNIIYQNSKGTRVVHDIVKYATNTWRTATIVLRDPKFSNGLVCGDVSVDLTIDAAESQLLWQDEFISKVQITNLDKSYNDPYAASKTDILHTTEAMVLSDMGLFDSFVDNGAKYGLDKPLTLEEGVKTVVRLAYGGTQELKSAACSAYDVSEEAKPYVGLALEKGIIKANPDGSIGAGQIITMKNLLDMFIRTVENNGYRDISDTASAALSMGVSALIKGQDGHGYTGAAVYNVVPGLWTIELENLDRYAYMDDLAAASYNMMKLTVNGNEKPVMATLYDRGVFNDEDIVTSGCGRLTYEFYRQTGFRLVEESYVDPETGVTINYLSLPGLPSTGAYAHSQNVSSDNRYIAVCAAIDHSTTYGVNVVYDRETKTTTPLHPDLKESYYYGLMVAVDTDEIFYTCAREVYCFDLKTMTNKFIGEQSTDTDMWNQVVSVTSDGNWIVSSGYDRTERRNLTIDLLNTRTGEFETMVTKEEVLALKSPALASKNVNYTLSMIDHININPKYENLVFYNLHYKESGSPTELWLYNRDTKEHKLLFSEHLDSSTGKRDMSSAHYVWTGDGEKIYWVQYTQTNYLSGIGENGIAWTTKDGRADYLPEGWINSDYCYNHVGASGDFKYVVGDAWSIWTGERFESKLSVSDVETGESRLLANRIGMWRAHPGHTHPVMSKDGGLTTFTMAVDNDHLVVGFVDVTNLPEEDPDKFKTAYAVYGEQTIESGVERYHALTDVLYYSTTQSEIGYIGGKSCVKVNPGNRAPFDVLADYVDAFDHTVTFRLEYFDNGTETFKIRYNSNNIDGTVNDRKYTPFTITRTGTNQWITKDFTITDASFINGTGVCTDFEIYAQCSAPVYIKSIYVSKGDAIQEVAVDTDIGSFESIKAFADDAASPITIKGNYTKETADDGAEYVKLTGDGYVSFKIDDSIEAKTKDTVKIAVTYYDLGLGHISLQYNAKEAIAGMPATKDYMPYKINRKGGYIWKTEIIELSNADFRGRQSDGADFRITASNSNVPIYIKQVELITE